MSTQSKTSTNESKYTQLVYYLWSLEDPISWIIDKSATSLLDLGCGQGNTTKVIKARNKNITHAVGVELFDEYIKVAESQKIFDEIQKKDVRDIVFPDKSFDIVVASQIIEHIEKDEAWKLIENMRRIARKQIIISTPIGECFHPDVDHNQLQLHKSYYYPEDFTKKNYKVVKYGWKWLLDSHTDGVASKIKNPYFLKLLYGLNFALTPVYYTFQKTCDYIFVAYQNVE